jgi:FkbM family methyltransferase
MHPGHREGFPSGHSINKMFYNIFKFVFNPYLNRWIRRIVKPFVSIIPEDYLFPVAGFFKLRITKTQHIWLEGHYTSYITRQLYWHGIKGYEYDSVELFKVCIKKANVFFDIGANLGYYSLIAEKINPGVSIYAFEPFPDAIKALERNIERNQFRNIHVIPIALSDQNGEDVIYHRVIPEFSHHLQLTGDNTMVNFADRRNKQVKIITQTLDNFVEMLNPGSIDLIKIDTETTEYIILSNGLDAIRKYRPIIMCEIIPGKYETRIKELFAGMGYLFYKVEKGGLAFLPVLEVKGQDKSDFFFVPKEKENEFTGKILIDK